MLPERNYDPTSGRDARVAAGNQERTKTFEAQDQAKTDSAEIARKAKEQAKEQQQARLRHEQFQAGLAKREGADQTANQPNMDRARNEALVTAKSVDTSRRDFLAPEAVSGYDPEMNAVRVSAADVARIREAAQQADAERRKANPRDASNDARIFSAAESKAIREAAAIAERQRQEQTMKKTVNTDWEKQIAPLPKTEAPKSPQKKPWYQIW